MSRALFVDSKPHLARPLLQVVIHRGNAGDTSQVGLDLFGDGFVEREILALDSHLDGSAQGRTVGLRLDTKLDDALGALSAQRLHLLVDPLQDGLGVDLVGLALGDAHVGERQVRRDDLVVVDVDRETHRGIEIQDEGVRQRSEPGLDGLRDLRGLLQAGVRLGFQTHRETLELAGKEDHGETRRTRQSRQQRRAEQGREGKAVRDHRAEHGDVAPPQPVEAPVHSAAESAQEGQIAPHTPAIPSPPLRPAATPEIEVVGGQDHEALEERSDQADHHALREYADELPRRPLHEKQGSEGGHRRDHRGGHRPHHLVRALHHRLADAFAAFDVPVDVLQHDDGVVHQHAGDQQHPDQGVGVDADVEQREEDDRGQEAEGNGHDREQGVAKANGEPEQCHDEEHARRQVVDENTDSRRHEIAGVEGGAHHHPLWNQGRELLQPGIHPRREFAHVGLVLLSDGDDRCGIAVVARDEDPFLESALDPRHIAHADARPHPVFPDHRVEDLLHRHVVTRGPQRRLSDLVLEGSGGQVLVLPADSKRHVVHGEAVEGRAGAVHQDPHLPVLESPCLRHGNAGQLPQARLGFAGHVADGHLAHAPDICHHHHDDGPNLAKHDLDEPGLLGVEGQVLHLVERAPHVIDRGFVFDGAEGLVEVEVDGGDVGLGGRAHLVDVADAAKLLFEFRRNEALDLLRRGALPDRGDHGLVEGDVVEVLDLRELQRVPAGHDAHHEEHVHQNRLANTELRKRHLTATGAASTASPSRSNDTPLTATRCPSSRPARTSTWSGRKGTGRALTRKRRARPSSSTTNT